MPFSKLKAFFQLTSQPNSRLFFFLFSFLGLWWLLTLPYFGTGHESTEISNKILNTSTTISDNSLKEERLRQALDGDLDAIEELLSFWELQTLRRQEEGFDDIHFISSDDSRKARFLLAKARLEESSPSLKLLPQTYSSAAFLMALVPESSVLCIPKGMRRCENLYPVKRMERIPRDVEAFSTEELGQLKPDLVFIAPYSNPTVVQALKNLRIPTMLFPQVESLEDVQDSLIRMGEACRRPSKAQLMAIFLDGAFHAMDQELQVACQRDGLKKPKRLLLLQKFTHYESPSSKTLLVKLLARIGCPNIAVSEADLEEASPWSIPLSFEAIKALDPDFLLFLSADEEIPQSLRALSPDLEIRAFSFDRAQSLSQYLLLAYWDLVQILMEERA